MTGRRQSKLRVRVLALGLILAACGGSDVAGEGTSPSSTNPQASETTAAPAEPATSAEVSSGFAGSPAGGELSFDIADGWSATALGQGVKPALALDPSGAPGVTWLLEKIGDGFVAFAEKRADWEVETLIEGYFYGPIGLAYGPAGTPNVVIHDHQADNFNANLGDLMRLFKDGSEWVQDTVHNPGHDGWDSTVVIGDDGTVHAAGIDPAQFGRIEGVEYYVNSGDGWEVSQIGSGPIQYQYNVALAVDDSGSPSLTYFNDTDQDLVFADFEGGSWNLERVVEEGNVGKYSSLAFDGENRPGVSYFHQTGGAEGEIGYAFMADGGWTSEIVGPLTAFSEGNARRNSSLAFDSLGRAHVAFSDTQGVWYSIRGDSGWETQQIVQAGNPLGQLVSLAIDGDDRPHFAIYEVTRSGPLDGIVAYITTSG